MFRKSIISLALLFCASFLSGDTTFWRANESKEVLIQIPEMFLRGVGKKKIYPSGSSGLFDPEGFVKKVKLIRRGTAVKIILEIPCGPKTPFNYECNL